MYFKWTNLIDLAGRTVIPGLNDAHTHMPLAAPLNDKYKVNLLDVPNMEAALQRIARQVKREPPGAWIVTSLYRGASFDEPAMREALNAISPSSLVYLRLTGKTFLLNAYGLDKLALSVEDLPPGADWDASGALTGYFYDEAADYVRRQLAIRYFTGVEPGAGCSGCSGMGSHRCRCLRIFRMTVTSSMTAMIRMVWLHLGHSSGSIS